MAVFVSHAQFDTTAKLVAVSHAEFNTTAADVRVSWCQFDTLAQAANVPVGGGFSRDRRKKRIYVEKDGNIYLFSNASDAASWLAAQKREEVKPKGKKRRIPRPQVIEIEALKDNIFRIQTEYKLPDLYMAVKEERFDILLMLQARLEQMREDDEIIVLLMAA